MSNRKTGKKKMSGNQDGVCEFKIIIAGAGTGGHLFPAIAVVEAMKKRTDKVKACFVTTGRPIENTVLAEKKFETARISSAGMMGRPVFGKIRALVLLAKGLFQARAIIKRFNPHLVLGMGGYSAAPVIISAWMMGVLRVIHEQNRVPGMTNRLLGRFSDRVYTSYEDTKISGAENKTRFTGNPVRSEIARAAEKNGISKKPASTKTKEKSMTILVLGGSQGAHSINMVLTGALGHLNDPGGFEFIHQTGPEDEEHVRAAYGKRGVKANVSAFFDDPAPLYQKADLAICRAGASTISELALALVPAVFIPYPHAAGNHQVANAEGMVSTGCAEMLLETDMTPKELARRITYYRHAPKALEAMKSNIAARYGANDAAQVIADDILHLAGFMSTDEEGGRAENV